MRKKVICLLGFLVFGGLMFAPSATAQCYVCEGGECKDGGGGSSCTQSHTGGGVSCLTEGGCECFKVEKTLWFDSQVCMPVHDAGEPTALSDVRYFEHDGVIVPLRRVGGSYFAARSCGGSGSWSILARELRNGEMRVTANPLWIRLQRWAFDLGADGPRVGP